MQKIRKVALLVDSSFVYGRRILRGIVRYSHLKGPWMFYRMLPFNIDLRSVETKLTRLKDWDPQGIIVREVEKIDQIVSMGLPTIVSRDAIQKFPDMPALTTDSEAIGKMAAEYLLVRGFRRFAFCGFTDVLWSRGRSEAFAKRIAEAGFQTIFYQRSRSKLKHSWDKEQIRMADWLKSLPKPIGLMACNDEYGHNVIEACQICQLHVPDQVAVIGVDNDDVVCNLSRPPLSSIVLSTESAGYQAAALLDRLMRGEKMAGQRILDKPTRIVTRQSTDTLAIEDRHVISAVRFIRLHANQVIQVRDVVDEAAVCRRSLERRFRKALGRSVNNEIRRARVEQIARMLLETDLSISQIARDLGYSDEINIYRFFRREKGMTPLAYRKKYGHI